MLNFRFLKKLKHKQNWRKKRKSFYWDDAIAQPSTFTPTIRRRNFDVGPNMLFLPINTNKTAKGKTLEEMALSPVWLLYRGPSSVFTTRHERKNHDNYRKNEGIFIPFPITSALFSYSFLQFSFRFLFLYVVFDQVCCYCICESISRVFASWLANTLAAMTWWQKAKQPNGTTFP